MGAVLRSEVLQALDEAEARGESRIAVIMRLHPRSTMRALKRALRDSGIRGRFRETEYFLMGRLSREEVQRVAQLTQHVSKISLDLPVSAMNA
jgi:hypothetical protein